MKTIYKATLAMMFCWLSLSTFAQTQTELGTHKVGTYEVGMRMLAYSDATRQNWAGNGERPLRGAIWYPAQAGSVEKELEISILKVGSVAVGAPIHDGKEKFPLVVMSHGTGGSAVTMGWLARSLAQQGFIVAAVNHHGNTAAESDKRAEGFLAWWERPRDLSVLIDKLLDDPVFGTHIDAQRIGVTGFSLGGYTALASIGARLNFKQWLSLCQSDQDSAQCVLPPEAPFSKEQAVDLFTKPGPFQEVLKAADLSYKDSRIRAAFVIAPVLVSHMCPESFSEMNVPVSLVVGDHDDQAVPEKNALFIAPKLKRASIDLLPKVTHYTFLVECTAAGKMYAKDFCSDPDGVDRHKIHQQIGAQASQFFASALK